MILYNKAKDVGGRIQKMTLNSSLHTKAKMLNAHAALCGNLVLNKSGQFSLNDKQTEEKEVKE